MTEIEKAIEREKKKIVAWIRKLSCFHEPCLYKGAEGMRAEIAKGILEGRYNHPDLEDWEKEMFR